MTTKQKMEMKEIKLRDFQIIMDSLVNYKEVHSAMGFYPLQRKYGPKVVFLPDAEPLTIYRYFKAGALDHVFTFTGKELSEFPPTMTSQVIDYIRRFADGREVFIKFASSYPIFDEQGKETVPSISLILYGVHNGNKPSRDQCNYPTPEQGVQSILGVYKSLQNLEADASRSKHRRRKILSG